MPREQRQVILIHPAAPAKPAEGQPCNGCGVCCLSAPCPIGMLISRKRHGACTALQWSDDGGRYVCGMLVAPLAQLRWHGDGAASRLLGRAVTRTVRRWIAAGQGCDSNLEMVADGTGQATSRDGEPRD